MNLLYNKADIKKYELFIGGTDTTSRCFPFG